MIREFTEADSSQCSALFIETIHTSNTHYFPADLVDLEKYFRVDNIPVLAAKTQLYVMELDGRIVATGALSSQNYLSLMYVHPSFQGRDFGDAMMQFLLGLADSSQPIQCNATDLAISFYEKYGFKSLKKIRYAHDEGDGELVFMRMIRE